MKVASYPFSKAAAISHSVAEDTIFLRILQRVYIGLLSLGLALVIFLMKLLRKKWPLTLLLALCSMRYALSLYTYKTMSEAVYVMVPFENMRRYSRQPSRALSVAEVSFVCYVEIDKRVTRGMRSIMRQQQRYVPTISYIYLICLVDSLERGGLSYTNYYF